jgi:hypothetical protein
MKDYSIDAAGARQLSRQAWRFIFGNALTAE